MSAQDEKKSAAPSTDDQDYVAYQEPTDEVDQKQQKPAASATKKGSYASIHSSGFRDFMLKEELSRAITDCGFEHPSEVQQEAIPQALLGHDIICQAKSGMGKTAVFVLAVLHQLRPVKGQVDTLVLCHTRELAYQICKEFLRFSKYLPEVVTKVFYGGIDIKQHVATLAAEVPNVVVGTPGRVLQLMRQNSLNLNHLKRFVLDECDQMLESVDMRADIQSIFKKTPHEKQVMMFSATLPKDIRPVCKKFTQNATEIYVDNESKLTLHGLQQYYVKLDEKAKNRKLNDLIDALEFNQVVIFVNGVRRCKELNKLLVECNFPSIAVFGGMQQEQRITQYNNFKEFKNRILVSTDVFGRGVDFERVNIVINYDMPEKADQYLHRVGRSGRFGTKGLAITFISSDKDAEILNEVQSRFEVKIPELPNEIDVSTYMNA